MKVIILSHSVVITKCLCPLSSCLATPHSCGHFSSVGIALQNHCFSPRTLSEDHNKVGQIRIHSMESETIKKALMTPPLTYALFCDKKVIYRKVNCRNDIFPQSKRKRDVAAR